LTEIRHDEAKSWSSLATRIETGDSDVSCRREHNMRSSARICQAPQLFVTLHYPTSGFNIEMHGARTAQNIQYNFNTDTAAILKEIQHITVLKIRGVIVRKNLN